MTTEERKAEDARFRQEYPLFAQYPELIYLDNAATTQKPSCGIQAEAAFYEKYNANRFRGVYELAEFATEHYEEARAAVAELLHANTDEIVFTRNASESLNLIAYSLGNLVLRPGDEVSLSFTTGCGWSLRFSGLSKHTFHGSPSGLSCHASAWRMVSHTCSARYGTFITSEIGAGRTHLLYSRSIPTRMVSLRSIATLKAFLRCSSL